MGFVGKPIGRVLSVKRREQPQLELLILGHRVGVFNGTMTTPAK